MKNKLKYANSSLCALIVFVASISSSIAKNYNEDVKLVVEANLRSDDYAELLIPAEQPKIELTREVITDYGLNAKRVDDVVYFYLGPNFKKYNLTTESWLTDFTLPEAATAFDVDSSGYYIAHGRAVYFYSHDGSPRVFFGNTADDITGMTIINDFVVAEMGDKFNSYNKLTGAFISGSDFFYTMIGSVSQGSRGKIFGRNTGTSPCDIVEFSVDGSGNMSNQNDSPYHGDYPCSSRVYSFPDESRLVDGSGILYHAADLTYAGSFAGAVDHVDFYGDLPIVLRGNTLYSYSNSMTETGVYTMAETKDLHVVEGETIYTFKYAINSVNIEKIDISLLNPAEPGNPVNPVGLEYTPDAIIYDQKDRLYILDRNNLSVHIFNSSIMSYEQGFGLVEAPLFMSYSDVNDKIYLAYNGGKITEVELDGFNETVLVNSPQTPCGLSTADSYIFVCDPSGAWVSHFTYSSSGDLISQEEWNYYSYEYHWSSVNGKMYHFRDASSPNDLIWEDIGTDGVIGQSFDSPYHQSGWFYPICVNPNGSNVIIGSGIIYDAISLVESNFLSNDIKGCAWSKGRLYTLKDEPNTYLQSWSDVFQEQYEIEWSGEAFDVFGLRSGALIIIHMINNIPEFEIYNDLIFASNFD